MTNAVITAVCNRQGEHCPLHHRCAEGHDCPDYHCCGLKCRSYEAVRDRLRKKMEQKARTKRKTKKVGQNTLGIIEGNHKSIDELLAFINGDNENKPKNTKKKKRKKKKESKSKDREELRVSLNELNLKDEKTDVFYPCPTTTTTTTTNTAEEKIPTKNHIKDEQVKRGDLKKYLRKNMHMDFSALFDESKFEDDIDQDQDKELKAFQKRLAGVTPLW